MLTISLASPVPIHDQLVAGLRGLIANTLSTSPIIHSSKSI